jgi:uncharacterized RDD family membrane protein YckC
MSRPPGWYPDASVPGHERWWDGGSWSHVTRPVPGTEPAAAAQPTNQPTNQPANQPTNQPANQPAGYGAPGGYPSYPAYPQAPGVPAGYVSTKAVTTPDGVPLAGPGWRLLARFIDGLLIGIVALAVGFPFLIRIFDAMTSYLDKVDQASRNGTVLNPFEIYTTPGYLSGLLGIAAVQLALSGIYHTTFIALRGATLGKLAAGVRVRLWTQESRPTWGQAALRWACTDLGPLLPFVGSFYTLLDALWLLWDDKRQCLHDKLPKTSVVRSR